MREVTGRGRAVRAGAGGAVEGAAPPIAWEWCWSSAGVVLECWLVGVLMLEGLPLACSGVVE